MTMTYRGISHDLISSTSTLESEIVEGIYHGLQTEIQLPQRSSQPEMLTREMTYRGVKI